MAQKEFILQGFTTRTHGAAVRDLFDIPEITRVIVSVAFVSEDGVRQIESQLKSNSQHLTVFAGIRNDITSSQGLTKLHETGGSLYAVDTGSRQILFHPKLFYVRGKNRARLVLGSANLTLGGLHNNIEAGMLVDFDLAKSAADTTVVNDIESKLLGLPKAYPKHVLKISKSAEISELLVSGRLIDETVTRPPRPTSVVSKPKDDTVPLIKLAVPRLYGAKKALKKALKTTSSKAKSPLTPVVVGGETELVWQSLPLKARSLGIKKVGSKTNPTGSTTLGKGAFKDIDPVTYFRKDVFGSLKWSPYKNQQGNAAERANADFDLVIKGAYVGTFPLTLRHSLTRAKAAAEDKNVPTELCWDDAINLIRRDDLLGRILRIFRSETEHDKFIVDID